MEHLAAPPSNGEPVSKVSEVVHGMGRVELLENIKVLVVIDLL